MDAPRIDLLSVVRRQDDDEDRVVARVRFRITSRLPARGVRRGRVDERWTFGWNEGQLELLAVGGDPLAGPILSAPLVPNPAADTERLHAESLAELAFDQQIPDDVELSDLVRSDDPPAFALPDLSVVDSRFQPALIAASIAHIIESWEVASTGSEAPLAAVADAGARDALLRPGPHARLLVRDAVLVSWEPIRLRLVDHPPSVDIALDVRAVRFVVDDQGSRVAGNAGEPHDMALNWVLELTDLPAIPWRLTRSSSPAMAVGGWT